VSDARREGRVMEGLCLDPPDGFRIDDALAIYGGLPAVETACGDCPANSTVGTNPRPSESPTDAPSLAGCYGCVALPSNEGVLHAATERAIATNRLVDEIVRLFLKTSPAWYGLWAASPLSAEQCRVLLPIVSALATDHAATDRQLAELHAGLQTSLEAGLPLHARLNPRGRVEGAWWRLARHCALPGSMAGRALAALPGLRLRRPSRTGPQAPRPRQAALPPACSVAQPRRRCGNRRALSHLPAITGCICPRIAGKLGFW